MDKISSMGCVKKLMCDQQKDFSDRAKCNIRNTIHNLRACDKYPSLNKVTHYRRLKEEGAWGPYWLDLVQQHGLILCCWTVLKPRVFVADPLVIKEMVTDFKTFPRSGDHHGFIAQ